MTSIADMTERAEALGPDEPEIWIFRSEVDSLASDLWNRRSAIDNTSLSTFVSRIMDGQCRIMGKAVRISGLHTSQNEAERVAQEARAQRMATHLHGVARVDPSTLPPPRRAPPTDAERWPIITGMMAIASRRPQPKHLELPGVSLDHAVTEFVDKAAARNVGTFTPMEVRTKLISGGMTMMGVPIRVTGPIPTLVYEKPEEPKAPTFSPKAIRRQL